MESTKLKSLKQTKAKPSSVRNLVLTALKNGPLTRNEIAETIDRRLSSVCGRINELLRDGLVEVVGTTQDSETDREVEVLGRKSLDIGGLEIENTVPRYMEVKSGT